MTGGNEYGQWLGASALASRSDHAKVHGLSHTTRDKPSALIATVGV